MNIGAGVVQIVFGDAELLGQEGQPRGIDLHATDVEGSIRVLTGNRFTLPARFNMTHDKNELW